VFLKEQNKTAAEAAAVVVVVVVIVVVETNGKVNVFCSEICYLYSHIKTRHMIKPFIRDHL
jgi:hypothetical protein